MVALQVELLLQFAALLGQPLAQHLELVVVAALQVVELQCPGAPLGFVLKGELLEQSLVRALHLLFFAEDVFELFDECAHLAGVLGP